MKKILIIQTAFIGDVILGTSLIETLYEGYSTKVEIDVLVRKGNESLLSNHPKVSELHVWDKKKGKYKSLFALIRKLKKTNYDFIYNLQRFGATGYLTWRLKGGLKVGFSKNPFAFSFDRKVVHEIGNGRHEIERNFDLVKADLPKGAALLKPKLYPSVADKKRVEEVLDGVQNYIVLAPASVWFTKQLPQHKWVELIRAKAEETNLLLIGAPSDKEWIDQLIVEAGVGQIKNLAGELSLLQSAALIEKAERTFVNDSAPLHLASAMNAPVTAFFCSTVPSFGFTPLSDEVLIKETTVKLACRPCGLHGFKACPKKHFDCGNQIDVLSD